MNRLFLILLLAYSVSLQAQVTDDFSDGDFTSGTSWTGDTSSFQVNTSRQLQLNAPAAGEAFLSTASELLHNARWEFYVKLSFSPSSQNFSRIYLASDKADLSSALNGYYIQLGEAGSLDGIDLFRQDSLTMTKVIDGIQGHVAKSTNTLRIRVECDSTGNWRLWSDTTGGFSFSFEGSASDNTYQTAKFMGIYARFSSSNVTKFIWDDFKAGPFLTDNTPPSLNEVLVISKDTLLLHFDEQLDKVSVESPLHYAVNLGIGQPVKVWQDPSELSKVWLNLSSGLTPNIRYSLTVSGISDLNNNTLSFSTRDFIYERIMAGDIVLNEIMADPSPPVDLPEEEYVELLNRCSRTIKLKGWILSDGVTKATFPDDSIEPNARIIVTRVAAVSRFLPYGHTIGLNLPSLDNSGDNIMLIYPSGQMIDRVQYTDDWYRESQKRNGGWSLERIDPGDTCHKEENWKASEDRAGGTPGRVNSVYAVIKDTIAPSLVSYTVADSMHIRLVFDERLGKESITAASFKLNGGSLPNHPELLADGHTVQVMFYITFIPGRQYTFSYSGLRDCNGNAIAPTRSFTFIYYKPQAAVYNDVLINEIMSDPDPGVGLPSAEYLELFNRSKKTITLNGWTIADPVTKSLLPDFLLLPDSFVILCHEDNAAAFHSFGKVLALKSFPSLNNGGDTLMLFNCTGSLIHSVIYTDRWHRDAMKRSGGWSLEMIDPQQACACSENWTSSINPSGGTPGHKNSVSGKINSPSPALLKAFPADSLHVLLTFSMPVDSTSLADKANYTVDKDIGNPIVAKPLLPDFRRVQLTLSVPLKPKTIFQLTTTGLKDCNGFSVKPFSLNIAIPERPDSFDLVINEILFNPQSGGEDFIELFNRSSKVIDISGLLLANTDDTNAVKDFYPVTGENHLLFPEEYVVLTPHTTVLQAQYFVPFIDKVIEMPSMPAYNDDQGAVVILRKDGLRIDQVNYSEDWQFSLLHDKNGVSIEKLYPDLPSQLSSSWHSAASTVGYATPTYRNSQYLAGNASLTNTFTLDQEEFSPDNDGHNDILNIHYSGVAPGTQCTVEILDTKGREVRQLLNNRLLSEQGILSWDGTTDNQSKAPIGVYLILITTYQPGRDSRQMKLDCTLSGKL